ncbi:COG1361 family protein [Thermococcus barophilus]|uniref:CARDB domain-containing protein n=1 Tax=Thermococcus barophilus TaxID=55802 RepID=A0A0S1XCB2_THEBA|nr:hypothetical protein [Thermococcus barophilus]ALM75364.1 hypothetical protein TBCH5v1_1447 [Thermococcus barophilus]
MKRCVVSVLFLLILADIVSASTIIGWANVPQTLIIGNMTIDIRDMSSENGALFLLIKNDSLERNVILNVGSWYEFGHLRISLQRSIIGNKNLAYLNITYPVLFIGESVIINGYNITLENAELTKKGASFKLIISNGTSSKVFTKSPIKYGTLEISVIAFPKIFSGYLKLNNSIEFYGHMLSFKNVIIENTSSGYREVVVLESGGVEKEVEVGTSTDIGIYHVVTKELVGAEYLLIEVYVRGADIGVKSIPSFTKRVYEGKDLNIPPYLIRVEKVLADSAYITIRNSCGEVLAKGFINSGNFTSMLYYKGIGIWLTSTGFDSSGGYAEISGIVYPTEIPKVSKISALDVSFTPLTNRSIQYSIFKAKITIKNIGDYTLRNIYVRYTPPKGIGVIGESRFYINNLTAGSVKEYTLLLQSNITGNVSLGKVDVTADVPYELACGGYKAITFYSNSPIVHVTKADVRYVIDISAPSAVNAGELFNITLTVKNLGNVNVPITVKVPLKDFAVVDCDEMTHVDRALISTISINPNESKVYHLALAPINAGDLNLTAMALFKGQIINKKSTVITATAPQIGKHTETVTVTAPGSTNNQTKTNTVTISKTATLTRTFTKTITQTEEIMPLKFKILWWILGFIIGAGVIILIAWIQAKRS